MATNIYQDLQKRLDFYSLGFPATESGIELKILEELFSEEDAAMFLALSPKVTSPQLIAATLGRPEIEVATQLEDMAKRGLLFRLEREEGPAFGAIPFIHGIFEFQVKRLDSQQAKLLEEYYESGLREAMRENVEGFLRVIPVNRSIELTHEVAAFDDAIKLLENAKKIVVAECICRKQQRLLGEGCNKPSEVCFLFGSMGQYYVDNDMGREVSVSEAIQILTSAQDAGLVTQPATSQNPTGMCNCCSDCCGVLKSIRSQQDPAELVFSNHFALIDADECSGCETCIERCEMDAIELSTDSFASVLPNRCIGCGLCVTTCPTGAATLVRKPRDEQRVPPKNSFEQMMSLAKKRGLIS